jgi:hypothetical protein
VEYQPIDRLSGTWKVSTATGAAEDAWAVAEVKITNTGIILDMPLTALGGRLNNLVTAIPVGAPDELDAIRGGTGYYPLGWYYVMYNDIDLGAYSSWRPVGTDQPGGAFDGTFDGGNHVIRNLKINDLRSPDRHRGLFGVTGRNAVVKNIKLENGSINAGEYSGGIAGLNQGSIIDCSYSGTVTGFAHTGGIAGGVENGEIANCVFEGTVSSSGKNYSGGIAGSIVDGRIKNCVNRARVMGKDSTGGICGGARGGNSLIANCTNQGDVSGEHGAGGIVGNNSGGTVFSCFFVTTNLVRVQGKRKIGGIAGDNNNGGVINSCMSAGSIMGEYDTGGIAGRSSGGEIIASKNVGDVNAIEEHAGGIVGYNENANVISCYNVATVSSWDIAGGLIGVNSGKGIISSSYCVSAVKGNIPGGIIGDSSQGVETNRFACYWFNSGLGTNGYIGVSAPPTDTHAKPFGDTTELPFEPWPQPTTHLDWGIGDGSARGRMWKSLGAWNGGGVRADYPKRYWE